MNVDLAPTTSTEADLVLIEERVRQLFTSMGFRAISVRNHHVPPQLYIHIEAGPDGKLLIGTHGAHLASLQHIIRTILRHTVPAGTRITVDVNDYRARREQDLMGVAEAAATRALMNGTVVALPPMNSADRRIIHTALANRTDIQTASSGVEPARHVVIRPVSL